MKKNTNFTPGQPKTLLEAVRYFASNENCVDFVRNHCYPNGVVTCLRCNSARISPVKGRPKFRCLDCKYDFSIKVNTIFEKSPLPLTVWLPAIWQMGNSKNAISSHELARSLGVTQKTAWFMSHRIRKAMQAGSFKKFTEVVEADEAYIGGSRSNWSNEKRANTPKNFDHKTAVVAIIERAESEDEVSQVKASVISDTKHETIRAEIRKNVAEGAVLNTDESAAYSSLASEYWHTTVNHSASEYSRGNVTTNRVEGWISLFKRGLKGTHIHVAPFHLDRYLDDQTFRFNNRKTNDFGRFDICVSQVKGRRLTYKQLTGRTAIR